MNEWFVLAAVAVLLVVAVIWWQRARIASLGTSLVARIRAVVPLKVLGLAVASVLFGGAAWYLQVVAPDISTDDQVEWWIFDFGKQTALIVTGVLCQAIAIIAPFIYGLAEARSAAASRATAVADAVDQQTAINVAFRPLVQVLAKLSGTDGRKGIRKAGLQGEAKQAALVALPLVVGGKDNSTRCCYYRLETDLGGKRLLVPDGSFGRADNAKRTFAEGTEHGDEALAALDAGNARTWSYGDAASPPGWDTTKSYQTYISVPVSTPEKVFGMLTVDSPNADAFDMSSDVATVDLVAQLLATALAL